MLHELLPMASNIALLVNPRVPLTLQNDIDKAEAAARRLGLDIIILKAASEDEIERAFAIAAQQGYAVHSVPMRFSTVGTNKSLHWVFAMQYLQWH
jgi:hypothetical protein